MSKKTEKEKETQRIKDFRNIMEEFKGLCSEYDRDTLLFLQKQFIKEKK